MSLQICTNRVSRGGDQVGLVPIQFTLGTLMLNVGHQLLSVGRSDCRLGRYYQLGQVFILVVYITLLIIMIHVINQFSETQKGIYHIIYIYKLTGVAHWPKLRQREK